MTFDAIFLTLFVVGWLVCGMVPWVALSVATRGNAGLGYLPAAMAVGVLGGLAVPMLGMTGMTGLWLSFVAAVLLPALLLAARRVSLGASAQARAARAGQGPK